MKRILSSLLTLAFFAAILAVAITSKRTVRAVYAGGGCSVANLSGNYAFNQTGFEAKNTMGAPLPFANVGVSTFNGAGNVSVVFTDMSPGKPDGYGTPLQGATGSGTYTVNSDCTGSVSITNGDAAGITFNIVIIGGGTEVFGINTTPFVIGTSDLKKQ